MKKNKPLIISALILLLILGGVFFNSAYWYRAKILYAMINTGPEDLATYEIPKDLPERGTIESYCGPNPPVKDFPYLPGIGCMILSASHSAERHFYNHAIKVSVNEKGMESFEVDGVVVKDMRTDESSVATNIPYVYVYGKNGYEICETSAEDGNCPVNITVHERNPDKTVILMVGRCGPSPRKDCATNPDVWKKIKESR